MPVPCAARSLRSAWTDGLGDLRRARVPVPCAELALRIARPDGLASLFSRARPPPPARASFPSRTTSPSARRRFASSRLSYGRSNRSAPLTQDLDGAAEIALRLSPAEGLPLAGALLERLGIGGHGLPSTFSWSAGRPGVVRSTKAGASTPATLALKLELRNVRARSTKAGASTPATPTDCATCGRRRVGRSTKAGASTPATRLSLGYALVRLPHRSTKAGALTPATPCSTGQWPCSWGSLNEGRSVNPGDTPEGAEGVDDARRAQRRPER